MLAKWELILRGCDYQPDATSVCGQIAVAAIVGRPLLEVLARHGKDTRTNKQALIAMLAPYGFTMNPKAQRKRPQPGELAIGTYRAKRPNGKGWQGGHWVAWRDGEAFDAIPRNLFERDTFDEHWKPLSWHIIERTSDNGTAVPLT